MAGTTKVSQENSSDSLDSQPLVVHEEWPSEHGYTIKRVERFEEPEFTQLSEQIFYRDFPGLAVDRLISDEEKLQRKALKEEFGFPNMIRPDDEIAALMK